MTGRVKARFIAPMLLLKTDALPDDRAKWPYQLRVDGYRCIAFKTGGNSISARATTTTSRSAIPAS